MSNEYTIKTTNGETEFVIQQGQANGYDGYDKDTDLKLHGVGFLNWGGGLNENILRIVENFSVDAKILGDYNPVTSAYDYDPNSNDILPKDQYDLGNGLGVNNPVVGQLWFNTTENKMFVYAEELPNIFKWILLSSSVSNDLTMPFNPSLGTLWFDSLNLTPSSCVTHSVLKIYNPSHPQAVSGWVDVISDAVKICGDTMTGALSISTGSDPSLLELNADENEKKIISFKTGNSNRWSIYVDSNAETGSDIGSDLYISSFSDSGLDITEEAAIQIKRSDGKVILNGDPIEPLHAVTKQYVDDVANQDTGVVAGTYDTVTVNSKGKVIFGTNSVPAGSKMLFTQVSAPVGWTQDVSDNATNRMLRVVNTAGGGIGGTHSPILNNVVAAHTHSFNTGAVSADHIHYGSTSNPGNFMSGSVTAQTEASGGIFSAPNGVLGVGGGASNRAPETNTYGGVYYRAITFSGGSHAHSFSTGGISANHSHAGSTDNGSSQTNWVPRYLDLINCTKN